MRTGRWVTGIGASILAASCGLPVQGLQAAGDDAAAPADAASSDDGAQPEAATTGDDAAQDAAQDTATAMDASDDTPPPPPPSDAGDAGSPPPCGAVLFCDDFEGDLSKWTPHLSGGQLAIDSTRYHRGAHSLHASLSAATGNITAYALAGHAQAWPKDVFVRAFVYLPSPAPTPDFGIIDMEQDPSAADGAQIYLQTTSPAISVDTWSNGSVTWGGTSATTLPLDQWVCLEWELDSAGGHETVSLNGAELTDVSQPVSLPPLGVLKIGGSYATTGNVPQYDVWFDDVYVDDKPIGCAK